MKNQTSVFLMIDRNGRDHIIHDYGHMRLLIKCGWTLLAAGSKPTLSVLDELTANPVQDAEAMVAPRPNSGCKSRDGGQLHLNTD